MCWMLMVWYELVVTVSEVVAFLWGRILLLWWHCACFCSLPWKYVTLDSNGSVTQYLISLCQPLSSVPDDCGLNSSVCMISNGRAKAIGYVIGEFSDTVMTENPTTREFILQLEGSQCKVTGQQYRTFIIFKCSKTLVCDCCFSLHCQFVIYSLCPTCFELY